MNKKEFEQVIDVMNTNTKNLVQALAGMVEVEPAFTPPPPPEAIKKLPYVTVDGKRPPEPVSFFHTKKFIGIGAIFGILAAYVIFVTIIL